MTRETKIGLLVGLAFILVIGILLSDHFRGTMEPPSATLDRAGTTVRQTINSPGSSQSGPVTMAPPQDVNPRTQVPTPGDIEPRQSPIVMAPKVDPIPTASNGGLSPSDPLVQEAQKRGEEIVPAGNGADSVGGRSYQAQPGDTVSRMAAKFLGGNTHQNRAAIVAANPSLAADPNKVIVGQTYIIPGAAPAAIAAASTVAGPTAATPGERWVYTVKSGDTLWAIATTELGSASTIEAIKELNRDILHGSSTLRVGMKLKLPSPPLAIAN
jgi:nucleoid-associated protein YgaU